jgi:hypothetical protein
MEGIFRMRNYGIYAWKFKIKVQLGSQIKSPYFISEQKGTLHFRILEIHNLY